MPSETTSGASGTQAAAGVQPQEGASQAQAADPQQPQAGSGNNESSTEDVAQLRQSAEAANREAAKYRSELRKLQEAAQKAEEGKLSETDKQTRRLSTLERENTDLHQQLKDERTRSRVMTVAQKLGYADPGDAFRLLDHSSIDFDDAGEPKNLDKQLSDLLKAKPYLGSSAARATGSAEGGMRGSPTQGRDWFREAVSTTRRGG